MNIFKKNNFSKTNINNNSKNVVKTTTIYKSKKSNNIIKNFRNSNQIKNTNS